MANLKLDKKDREILFHLDLDARAPLSSIAKKVKLSKQVVKYRIDRMIKDKLIERFLLFVNSTRLGYVAYKFYIQFHNIQKEKLDEIVKELVAHPFIIWVATCDGKYDVAIAPMARNNVHAFQIQNELLIKYNEYIKDILPLNYIDVSHLKKVYLTGITRDQIEAPYWGDEPKNYELDDIEIKILTILCDNARKSLIDIAREVKCTVEKVNTRIKRLLHDKVIQGSTIILNKSLMGYQYHKVLLKMRFFNNKEEKTFMEFVKNEKNIVDIIRMMGDWNFELDIEVKNIYEFHDIMMLIKNTFPKNIQSYDTLLILKEHKLNFFPLGKLIKAKS